MNLCYTNKSPWYTLNLSLTMHYWNCIALPLMSKKHHFYHNYIWITYKFLILNHEHVPSSRWPAGGGMCSCGHCEPWLKFLTKKACYILCFITMSHSLTYATTCHYFVEIFFMHDSILCMCCLTKNVMFDLPQFLKEMV